MTTAMTMSILFGNFGKYMVERTVFLQSNLSLLTSLRYFGYAHTTMDILDIHRYAWLFGLCMHSCHYPWISTDMHGQPYYPFRYPLDIHGYPVAIHGYPFHIHGY